MPISTDKDFENHLMALAVLNNFEIKSHDDKLKKIAKNIQ